MSLGVLLSGKLKNDVQRDHSETKFHRVNTQSMTEEENKVIKEIDANFVDIAEALKKLNDCILTLNDRLATVENVVTALVEANNEYVSFDKVVYKPLFSEDHVSIKDNLDIIYNKLEELEKHVLPH